MYRIEPYRPADHAAIVDFAAAIQEHERVLVPALRTGEEIKASYTERILARVAERNGLILVARDGDRAVGFACAWVDEDSDPLLRDEARHHAYVSDIYVAPEARRRGVARRLLDAIATEMRRRGCRRIRICSKATNAEALACYDDCGFRAYEVILEKPLG